MRLRSLMAGAIFSALAGTATASIVLQDNFASNGISSYFGVPNGHLLHGNGMNSFVFYDNVPRSNAAYLAQRSRTWASYRNSGDPYRRFGMVYTPAAGGAMSGISDRQALVRDHISRATAYRLRYFDK